MEQLTCQRCGHTWDRRTERPRRCPNCTSPQWDKPRRYMPYEEWSAVVAEPQAKGQPVDVRRLLWPNPDGRWHFRLGPKDLSSAYATREGALEAAQRTYDNLARIRATPSPDDSDPWTV